MAGRWRRGGGSGVWCTRAGELLELIYEHYEEALRALPLEDMPVLALRLLDAGVCIGFADPVTNIIANTLFFLPDTEEAGEPALLEPEPNGAKKRKRKRKKLKTKAFGEARVREEVLSKIVAGDGPSSPPEARTLAERSLEGLVCFLTSYFRHLPTCEALRYLCLARADLLVAVRLIQDDRCYRHSDELHTCSSLAVKTALKCAACSAMLHNFDAFITSCFALASHIKLITQTLSAKRHCRLTTQDICGLSAVLKKPLKFKRSDKYTPMNLAAERFHDREINASIENVPGELTESLRGVLMDRIHGHYLKVVPRLPMEEFQTCHHRGLLKAGYCFGPFNTVSNIIVNTIWYNTNFPPSEEFKVDIICTLRHVESRSLNGLLAFVRACFPEISEHHAMIYLLKSNLNICKIIETARLEGYDTPVCVDNGYKEAAHAASHPDPDAYCEFVVRCLPKVQSTIRSLLQASHILSSNEVLQLSELLSFPIAKALEPISELTEDALKMLAKEKEDFLVQQSFVRGKVQAALWNYEQTKGYHYELGIICGVNVNVGDETKILESKGQYSHVNFWASPDDGSGATLFFAEFSNYEDNNDNHQLFCFPASDLSAQVRCCYCECEGVRIVHPVAHCWEGATDFEKIACGEHTISNQEIINRSKRLDSQVGIFAQDGLYLDPAQNKLIQSVNRAAWVMNIGLDDEMRRRRPHPPQASIGIMTGKSDLKTARPPVQENLKAY
ncbi:hypothetical protein SORBI_3008G056800 [Sorghum bicolor]|uniref:Uncharacterized protein n=1 Tax=Sorghum bicolor TaxID=4558 RepID=A0A1B6PBS5_SORBI|nr:hypothetical protein SORBI_3008G056800 [Sorghum bicolor]